MIVAFDRPEFRMFSAKIIYLIGSIIGIDVCPFNHKIIPAADPRVRFPEDKLRYFFEGFNSIIMNEPGLFPKPQARITNQK